MSNAFAESSSNSFSKTLLMSFARLIKIVLPMSFWLSLESYQDDRRCSPFVLIINSLWLKWTLPLITLSPSFAIDSLKGVLIKLSSLALR